MNGEINISEYVRAIPDFPKPGILFRDITPLLASPDAFASAVDQLTEAISTYQPDVIAGIESRGFIFGVPVAQRLGLPFVPIRKPGKLPGETVGVSYELEYGTDRLEMHCDAVDNGQRVVIIDDLLATGGTAAAAAQLIEAAGGVVSGLGFVIELKGLNGRLRIGNERCASLLTY